MSRTPGHGSASPQRRIRRNLPQTDVRKPLRERHHGCRAEAPMSRMADEASFNEFVGSRSQALMRTAYLLTRDHQLAEDLLQSALFRAARAWSRIEGEPEYYVRRILYNE